MLYGMKQRLLPGNQSVQFQTPRCFCLISVPDFRSYLLESSNGVSQKCIENIVIQGDYVIRHRMHLIR